MRRLLFVLLGLALAVAPPTMIWAENGFTSVSATTTSATTTFTRIKSNVMVCNTGSDVVHFRIFTNEETAAAATTSHARLPAGTASDPKCFSFRHNPSSQGGSGWLAVAVRAASSTATVEIHTE